MQNAEIWKRFLSVLSLSLKGVVIDMRMKRIIKIALTAIIRTIIGMSVLGTMLFLVAGTILYWQAWLMLHALMIPMGISGIIFEMQDSGILERRNYRWDSMTLKRKASIALKYLATLSLMLVPALDFRFGWSAVPGAWSIFGALLLVLANIIWIVSKSANPYAGSGIEIYNGHKLCKTGPYARIRHPNYLGDLLLIVGLPLALGSWWGFMGAALLVPLLVERTLDEEAFLKEHLPGYTEYMRDLRWRIIPLLW